jgi:O-antigen/teichoic acid export membrane protein
MFLRRTILACGGLAMIACAVVLLTRRWLSVVVFGSEDQSEMIVVAAGSLVAVIAYNFCVELFTALRNIRFASVMQLVNGVAFAALGIGMLLGWRCSAESVLLSYGGSCLITAMLAGFVLQRVWHGSPSAGKPLPHGVLWARMAPFAAWVLLGSLLTNLFGVVDRYMILHFSQMSADEALDAVGNYYAARVVPLLLVSIAAMLATIIIPHLSHDWEARRRDLVVARLRLFVKVFGFALFATATAVLLFSPLLFDVGFHGKYPQGRAVLPWTLICCTWFGLSMILQSYLLCAEKAGLFSVSLAFGLALNVPLNLVLLPRLGLEGAVLSATASNALLLWSVCRFNHRFGLRLDTGVKVVLVLPILLCCGPWLAILSMVVVIADAVWGNRLLSHEEKRLLASGLVDYGKRFGPKRWFVNPGGA